MTVSDVRPEARQGFGAAAQAYVRGRPDYPDAVLGWLRDTLGVGAGRTVIELGAGTGKFTRVLLRTGAGIIAVEPVDDLEGDSGSELSGLLDELAGQFRAHGYNLKFLIRVLTATRAYNLSSIGVSGPAQSWR